jgi:hypothetical protein
MTPAGTIDSLDGLVQDGPFVVNAALDVTAAGCATIAIDMHRRCTAGKGPAWSSHHFPAESPWGSFLVPPTSSANLPLSNGVTSVSVEPPTGMVNRAISGSVEASPHDKIGDPKSASPEPPKNIEGFFAFGTNRLFTNMENRILADTFAGARVRVRSTWNLEAWDPSTQKFGRCAVIPPPQHRQRVSDCTGEKAVNGVFFFATTDGSVSDCTAAIDRMKGRCGLIGQPDAGSACIIIPPPHSTCKMEALTIQARRGPFGLIQGIPKAECATVPRLHEFMCGDENPAGPWDHQHVESGWMSVLLTRPSDDEDSWKLKRAHPTREDNPFRNIRPPRACYILPPGSGVGPCATTTPIVDGLFHDVNASTSVECAASAAEKTLNCPQPDGGSPYPSCLAITPPDTVCADDTPAWIVSAVQKGHLNINGGEVLPDPLEGKRACMEKIAGMRRSCERWRSAESSEKRWGSIVGDDGMCRIVPPDPIFGAPAKFVAACQKELLSAMTPTGFFLPQASHVAMTTFANTNIEFARSNETNCMLMAAAYTEICGDPSAVTSANTCFVLPPSSAMCGQDTISRHGGFVVRPSALVGGTCASHAIHVKGTCLLRGDGGGDPQLNGWDYRYGDSNKWTSWMSPISRADSLTSRVDGPETYHKAEKDIIPKGSTRVAEHFLNGTDAEVAEWESTRLWSQISERLGLKRNSTSMERWTELANVAFHGDDDPCAQQIDYDGTISSGYRLVGTFHSNDMDHSCTIGGDCILSPGVDGFAASDQADPLHTLFQENVVNVAARISSRVTLDKNMSLFFPKWWKWFTRSANTPSGRYFTHPGPCPLGSLPIANPDTCESASRQLRPIERQYDALFVHSTYNFGGTHGFDNAILSPSRYGEGSVTTDLAHTRQFNDIANSDRNAIERIAWDGMGRGTPHSNIQHQGRYYAQSIYAMILELVRAPEANVKVRGDTRMRHARYAMTRRYDNAPLGCSVHNPTWDTYFIPFTRQKKHDRSAMATCQGCPNGKDADKVDWVTYTSVCEATSNDGWHKEASLAFGIEGHSHDDIIENTNPAVSRATQREQPKSKRLPGPSFDHPTKINLRLAHNRSMPMGWESFLLSPEQIAPNIAMRERCPVGNCIKRVGPGLPRPAPEMRRYGDQYCTERTRCIALPPAGVTQCPSHPPIDVLLKTQRWVDVDALDGTLVDQTNNEASTIGINDADNAHDRCTLHAQRVTSMCNSDVQWGYALAPVTEINWDSPITKPPPGSRVESPVSACQIIPNGLGACRHLIQDMVGGIIHLETKTPAECPLLAATLASNCNASKDATAHQSQCIAIIPPGAKCTPDAPASIQRMSKADYWRIDTDKEMTSDECSMAVDRFSKMCEGPEWKARHTVVGSGWGSFTPPPSAGPKPHSWWSSARHDAIHIFKGAVPTEKVCSDACNRHDWCSAVSFREFTSLFHCKSRNLEPDKACNRDTGGIAPAVSADFFAGFMMRSEKTGKCLTPGPIKDAGTSHVHAVVTMEPCRSDDPRQILNWWPTTDTANLGRIFISPGEYGHKSLMCLDSYWGHYVHDGTTVTPIPSQREGEMVFRACKDVGKGPQLSAAHTTRRQARSQVWRFKSIQEDGVGYPHAGHLQTTASSTDDDNTAGTCASANSDGSTIASSKRTPWMNSCSRTNSEQFWSLLKPMEPHRACRLLETDWMSGMRVAKMMRHTTHLSKDFGHILHGQEPRNKPTTSFLCSRPRGTPAIENMVASSPMELKYWRELLVGSDISNAMVDVLQHIQYGGSAKDVIRTAWQKKYWDNVRRAYHMYNTRTETFSRSSSDVWSHLSCTIPDVVSSAGGNMSEAVTLIKNTNIAPPSVSGGAANVLQANVEEVFSNTWLNSRSSFLDKFSTSAVFTENAGPSDAVDDPLSVFRPFRYPFGDRPEAGVIAYNDDQNRACCEKQYAFADKNQSPLDRTMAFHVRTPKSVFRLGGWGSLASFIMPPATAQNVLCGPRSMCKRQCSEIVDGADNCLSITMDDVTLTGGSGCADHATSKVQKPHILAVERCHRYNSTSTNGGGVCRANYHTFTPKVEEATNFSDIMYAECGGGLDSMVDMDPWKAVSCFRYCRSYCQRNTEDGACVPGMSTEQCALSMEGGPPGMSYQRCDPENKFTPGWWCDAFATKFCGEFEGAKTAKACACFVSRSSTTSMSDNPICGNAACANADAYKVRSAKLTGCPLCSIMMAQNNCVRISDNVFGDGGGGIDASGMGGQKQSLTISGEFSGCGKQEKEGNFAEARESIFHDLRPFQMEAIAGHESLENSTTDPMRCIIIPPSTGVGACTELELGNRGVFYDDHYSADIGKSDGAITRRSTTDAYRYASGDSEGDRSNADCDKRAKWWGDSCASSPSGSTAVCLLIPSPGASCVALGADVDSMVRSGVFVHRPTGRLEINEEGQCASEAVRMQSECGGDNVEWKYEYTERGQWGATSMPFHPSSCKIIPPRGDALIGSGSPSCTDPAFLSAFVRDSGGTFFDDWNRTAIVDEVEMSCGDKARAWDRRCHATGVSSTKPKAGNTCYIIPPHGASCALHPNIDDRVRHGGFISTDVDTNVLETACATTATTIGKSCGYESGWSSLWFDNDTFHGVEQPYVPPPYSRSVSGGDATDVSPIRFYTKLSIAKGKYTISTARPSGWGNLCVENVLPVTNNSVVLENTHAGCKISMMGSEKGCPPALMTPAIFDDYAFTRVKAYSEEDCDKRAEYHGTVCGADVGVVKGSFRQDGVGSCIIIPPSQRPDQCASIPHLPRGMFDSWYYTDDSEHILGAQECTKFRDKLRKECGKTWAATMSDWQSNELHLANASCNRGMVHELDAGNGWDRSQAILFPLFDPAVSNDIEFSTLHQANNKYARMCAAICENSAMGCIGFAWDSSQRTCAFYVHAADIVSKAPLPATTDKSAGSTSTIPGTTSTIPGTMSTIPGTTTQVDTLSSTWKAAIGLSAVVSILFILRRWATPRATVAAPINVGPLAIPTPVSVNVAPMILGPTNTAAQQLPAPMNVVAQAPAALPAPAPINAGPPPGTV